MNADNQHEKVVDMSDLSHYDKLPVTTKTTIRQSYVDLRGINLGVPFIRENDMQPGQKYTMLIDELEDEEVEGTLDKSGFIGGLAILYNEFDLQVGDELTVSYDGLVLRISPPADRRKPQEPPSHRSVFDRENLKHIHIESYAPGNLRKWIPQTEADVYMVLGVLSEYTDYRYCCGASKQLLDKLGYSTSQDRAKPDAILIDRTTDQYVMAEFKMRSKEFTTNHKKEDVDVLVCWEDDETDKEKLPPRVLCLRSLLETAIKQGDIVL